MSPTQIELGNYGKPSNTNETVEAKTEKLNIAEFLKEVRTEFLKISWPSKDQVTREFISVLLLVAALTSIIYLIDKIFEFIVNFFRGRGF